MRNLFFAGGEKTLKKLSSWHFYRQIVNILNRIIPEERIVLREEDFTVTQGRVKGTDATILKVELPEPEESPPVLEDPLFARTTTGERLLAFSVMEAAGPSIELVPL